MPMPTWSMPTWDVILRRPHEIRAIRVRSTVPVPLTLTSFQLGATAARVSLWKGSRKRNRPPPWEGADSRTRCYQRIQGVVTRPDSIMSS